jgi:bifunctional enzyme CysN/CysC
MVYNSEAIATDVIGYLDRHEHKSLLRFITCGSVDDGKSTLIGRLLYESHMLFEDQLAALEADSKRVGTQGGDLDFALLLDGLSAEREQGITIDVAYRFFSTDHRKFIVADTPGHEQYTRNMVTGASTADVAVILADARKGILTQTRRHSYLVSLVGIRHVVLAVNKLDIVDYSREVFAAIEDGYRAFAAQVGLRDVVCIPVSALKGDNITKPSPHTPWYHGPTLLGYLESVAVEDEALTGPFRMPVQWVNRPHLDFRGFSGRIVGGRVSPGDRLRVVPGGQTSTVAGIVTYDGDLDEAGAGQSVTITLTDEIDVSRGQVLVGADQAPDIADQFEAHVIWMAEQEMLPGRSYLLKIGAKTVGVTIAQPKYKINVNTLENTAAKTLTLNEIGVCNLSLDQAIAFDPYEQNRDMGGFIIIDRLTNATVGAGMLHFALYRSHSLQWDTFEVDHDAHVALKGHRPCIVWLTGLPGSGKAKIADLLEKRLHATGRHTYVLDSKNLRHGLNRDLGFTSADRVENVRRIAEVARLMTDAGLITMVSAISPFAAERDMARSLARDGEFCEVFVDAPLAWLEEHDEQGLYRKARRGELPNVTGIASPYEPPESPEVRIDVTTTSPEEAAERIVERLRAMGVIS